MMTLNEIKSKLRLLDENLVEVEYPRQKPDDQASFFLDVYLCGHDDHIELDEKEFPIRIVQHVDVEERKLELAWRPV